MRYLVIFTIFLMIASCDSTRVYEDYNDLEDVFWHQDSLQSFTFQIEDSSRLYNLKATFRNATSYPFYNLYFQYTLTDSVGNVIIERLKEVDLFDPKTGKPNGSGLGDLFDHSFPLEEGYSFPFNGEFTISFEQYMRRDTLPFIMSIGARVEFAE